MSLCKATRKECLYTDDWVIFLGRKKLFAYYDFEELPIKIFQ